MDTVSLQTAYDSDAAGHPSLVEPDLSVPPSGITRKLSGENGGIQNNLIFGCDGIAKKFFLHAPKLRKIIHDFIIAVGTSMTDEEVINGFEIIREFLLNNKFDILFKLEEDMSKTAVRHVLWHLSFDLDRDHNRLHSLLKSYSPTQFGYEYE